MNNTIKLFIFFQLLWVVPAKAEIAPDSTCKFYSEDYLTITSVVLEPIASISNFYKPEKGSSKVRYLGLKGTVEFNDYFAIGGKFNVGNLNDINGGKGRELPENYKLKFNLAYGGLVLQPYILSSNCIRLSIPICFFGGIAQSNVHNSSGLIEKKIVDDFQWDLRFSGIESGLNFEYKFTDWLGITAACYYRYIYQFTDSEGKQVIDFDEDEDIIFSSSIRFYFFSE